MVLACDGVYDVFSNDELAMLLRAQIAEKHAECSTAENITHAIEDILNISLNRGSIDNMTIIVIVFENIFHERGIGFDKIMLHEFNTLRDGAKEQCEFHIWIAI